MGYEVHITRKEHWFDSEGPTISLKEWHRYVASDPELRLTDGGLAVAPDGTELAWVSEGTAIWTAAPDHRAASGTAPMTHDVAGNVHTKSPDIETIAKMHRIAIFFDAQVQGDEGEFYDAEGNVLPGDPQSNSIGAKPKQVGFFSRLFKGTR